jgi:carboxyl-terminal processing protease
MNRSVSIRLGILLTALIVTAGLLMAPAQPLARAQSVNADFDTLAEGGRFDELLAQLQTLFPQPAQNPVASLVDDLERFEKNDAKRTAQRREAYDKALAQLEEHVEADEQEKALIAAVKSHGLAEDPDLLLSDPRVIELVGKALEVAKQSEQSDNWLEALAMYRALDLLYEEKNTYQDQVDRARSHVRVLQMYAPKLLDKLYDKRAKRNGEDVAEEDDDPVELEDWQSRLKGIQIQMLRQTLNFAKRKHIDRQGYTPMIRGAVDAMALLLDTNGLDESFPSLENKTNVKLFRDYLARLSASLQEPGKMVNIVEARTIIDRVIKTNEQTLNLPQEVVIFEMTQGITGTLDDFSSVIWPQELSTFSRSTQGKFYGIGVQISRRDGRLLVVSPLENTPAMRAGLKAGDVIAQVDGRKTNTWTLNRAVQEITGPKGTQVSLGIERAGEPEQLKYDITRAEIVIESIRGWSHKPEGGWDYWIDKDSRIGYIRLSQFIPQSADDMDAAIEKMQEDGPINGLILDLRFNPGGLLSSAIDVSDRFIMEGPIVSTVDGQGKLTPPSKAHRARTYPNFPMAVLVNQGSASASEIVSGAIQDYHRAIIIGTRSFGKGSVQDLFQISGRGEAYLKLTTQYYMLPMKRIIHRKPGATSWGIQPDLEVQMTTRQIADALQLRQEADIIRDAGEPVLADQARPWAEERFRVPGTEPKVDGKNPDGTDRVVVEVRQPTPDMLLSLGLDAQLETALLVLKTRLASPLIKMAQLIEPAPVSQ